ncbi:MAG: SCO1664 family protein [Actinobacteria bacterium]|nr:SCO1664 family protein [Actinomycetota bacterium]MCL5445412.1 SCO1664 family protein [Actinomycetota bacterium]
MTTIHRLQSGSARPSLEILTHGTVSVHGRIPGSSNVTLLVSCELGADELLGVYKPAKGERRLWDFPAGLYRHEIAAFELSRQLGWAIVPETVERIDGPFGPGSIQRWVPKDAASHYFTLRDDPAWYPTLQSIAAFDVIANNADRKSGHVLLAEGRVWAIDNGLCFHTDPEKLRTVIWDFEGLALPNHLLDDVRAFLDEGAISELANLLEDSEIEALVERASRLVKNPIFPVIPEDRDWPPYPWPLV